QQRNPRSGRIRSAQPSESDGSLAPSLAIIADADVSDLREFSQWRPWFGASIPLPRFIASEPSANRKMQTRPASLLELTAIHLYQRFRIIPDPADAEHPKRSTKTKRRVHRTGQRTSPHQLTSKSESA